MKRLNQAFVSINELFFKVIKLGTLLLGLIILIYLLMGESSGPYVVSVIENIGILVSAITSQALIAIIIVAGFIYFGKINNVNGK